MNSDCSPSAVKLSSSVVVKKDSLDSLIVRHERLKLSSEDFQTIVREDIKPQDTSDVGRLTEHFDSKGAKEEKANANSPKDEPYRSSTDCSSDDESYPTSPASKCAYFVYPGTGSELDHCLYFSWESASYCWGIFRGAPTESCICRVVGVEEDGKPMLQYCAAFSIRGTGPCASWMGLYFLLPNLQERTIYHSVGSDVYQSVAVYSEYQDLVRRGSDPDPSSADNGFPSQFSQWVDLDAGSLSSGSSHPRVEAPAESSLVPDPEHTGRYEASTSNTAPNPAISAVADKGAIYVKQVDEDRITSEIIDSFVDSKLSGREERIYCHVCVGPKRNKPRRDTRPYALKVHLKSHFFKIKCPWCDKEYSNKANMIKNHSKCPNAPEEVA